MGLRDIVSGSSGPTRETLIAEAKALVELVVGECVAAGSYSADVQVSYDLAQEIAAWIESEGLRVAVQLQAPDLPAVLVIIPLRAPAPVFVGGE